MDQKDFEEFRTATKVCDSLLSELEKHHPSEMEFWYHGKDPESTVESMANSISRINLELSCAAYGFEERQAKAVPARKG